MTSKRSTHSLPSNGFRPGGAEALAGIIGKFHARLTPDGADAWLGEGCREGDMICASGGGGLHGGTFLQSLSRDNPMIERVVRLNEINRAKRTEGGR